MELITGDLFEPRFRYQDRKGIYPVIVDYDDTFRRLGTEPVLANDIDLSTEEGQIRFNRLVYSSYDGDVFSNVPSCPCRATKGGHLVHVKCSKCGFECLPVTEQNIEPLVWVRIPEGIPGFLNLTFYTQLRKKLQKNGFSALDWFLDPSYQALKDDCPVEAVVTRMGFKRGLTSFHDNFDDIMFALCRTRTFFADKEGKEMLRYVAMIREIVFCKYLPFPSKIGFILETVGERIYADPKMAPALNALLSIANTERARKQSMSKVESRIARAMANLAMFYQENEKNKLFPKKGIFRKLAYGVDPHWTFRTVITSKHTPHNHEEIDIPWGTAVLTLKLHIANKLRRENYTPNEIFTLIYDNVLRTHHKLERIFDELIAETPGGKGIPCTFTRFPSLKRGSTQRFYIRHIKRDPNQLSTSISVLCLKAPNADFDGDYMSGQLALDNFTARAFDRLAPSTGIMDLDVPFQVSDHAMQPAPVLSTINARLEEGEDYSVELEG